MSTSKILSLFEESLTVAMRPPKYNSQGFTLLEMIVTLAVAGIIFGFAAPSLLSWNKPLRDGSLQFKGHLSLIRSKAISSGQAYRLRPKSTNLTDYTDGIPRNFVVEYATNCKVLENNVSPATLRWQMASQFDLDLPPNVGITDIASTTITAPTGIGTVTNSLNWNSGKGICFDNRGIVDRSTKIILKDYRGDNKAKISLLDIGKIGNVDISTYSSSTSTSPTAISVNQDTPEF